MQRVDPAEPQTQYIMLSNTQELASQTYKVCASLASHIGVGMHAFVGGTQFRAERDILWALGKAHASSVAENNATCAAAGK